MEGFDGKDVRDWFGGVMRLGRSGLVQNHGWLMTSLLEATLCSLLDEQPTTHEGKARIPNCGEHVRTLPSSARRGALSQRAVLDSSLGGSMWTVRLVCAMSRDRHRWRVMAVSGKRASGGGSRGWVAEDNVRAIGSAAKKLPRAQWWPPRLHKRASSDDRSRLGLRSVAS